jgi:hypothetical protein
VKPAVEATIAAGVLVLVERIVVVMLSSADTVLVLVSTKLVVSENVSVTIGNVVKTGKAMRMAELYVIETGVVVAFGR